MKKSLLALALALLLGFAFIGCGSTTAPTTAAPVVHEFKVDGEFTAYEVTVSSNKPQVTSVTVTIEGGEITGFNLDCRQGTKVASTTLNNNGTAEDTTDDYYPWVFGWNTQTKKELGFGYKMHYSAYSATVVAPAVASQEGYVAWMGLPATTKLEWFEQANLLEAAWLEDGVYAAYTDFNGDFNIAGVTVSDGGYTKLAREAVALAKQGKFQAFVCEGTDFYMASMIVDEDGELVDLLLDTLQATKDTKAGTFVWKTSTKQQLGYGYKMHYSAYSATVVAPAVPTQAGYEAWLALPATTKLEWFEQANIITDYILEHGWNANLQAINEDAGMSLDGTTAIDGTAGVTVGTVTYFEVLADLFAKQAN